MSLTRSRQSFQPFFKFDFLLFLNLGLLLSLLFVTGFASRPSFRRQRFRLRHRLGRRRTVFFRFRSFGGFVNSDLVRPRRRVSSSVELWSGLVESDCCSVRTSLAAARRRTVTSENEINNSRFKSYFQNVTFFVWPLKAYPISWTKIAV